MSNNHDNKIRLYSSVFDMTGVGEEWLVRIDDLQPLAVFFNGMMRSSLKGNNDPTVALSDLRDPESYIADMYGGNPNDKT